ncbi:MAG TPA: hypothetical protein PK370_01155 [Candidatus Woesebacteria bacterium]|nr:hypothetical protein [Candidatus Woesebacteria bacterium]HPJ16789.1 hypothetical protein [Candidatus Woesebacteria bacterium]
MSPQAFWLLKLNDYQAIVSIVKFADGRHSVAAIGPAVNYYQNDDNSLAQAIDESLSQAAQSASILPEMEPDDLALILPPGWIDQEGKIIDQKKKNIESFCRQLKLKPIGFIPSDEALVESLNSKDGFPASFILLEIHPTDFSLSLVYLGKIKNRLIQPTPDGFYPGAVEQRLIELTDNSTLPPQIYLTGDYTPTHLEMIKNYSWIGKKDFETFLHFPDIIDLSLSELLTHYLSVILGQFNQPNQSVQPEIEVAVEDTTAPVIATPTLEETSASDFGFSNLEVETVVDNPPPEIELPPPVVASQPPKPEFKLPKISLPKLNLKFPRVKFSFGIILAVLPAILALLFVLAHAKVQLFITPIDIGSSETATLDSNLASQKTIDLDLSESKPATGKLTKGERAKGDVVIYNSSAKAQNLSRGTIILDDKNQKYELSTSVQVPASSVNFDSGTITMGQVSTALVASEIGPEYNIDKNVKLTFKDSAISSLAARVKSQLSGGSRSEVSAVSQADKQALEATIKTKIEESIEQKLNQEINSISGILKSTLKIEKNRLEFNREVGEEADTISVESSNKVTVYYLTSEQKETIIKQYLSSKHPGIQFKYDLSKIDIDYLANKLTIKGQVIPVVDTSALRKQITGKSLSTAENIIKTKYQRVYNFQITTNYSIFKFLPLPFIGRNIEITSQ